MNDELLLERFRDNKGILWMDFQHQQLYKAMLSLKAALYTENEEIVLKETIEFLDLYILEHLELEDRYMREYNYPHYAEHHDKHLNFCNIFNQFKDMHITGLDLKNTTLLLSELIQWFSNHIMVEDEKLGAFFKKYGISVGERLCCQKDFTERVSEAIARKKLDGTYKMERIITSAQGAEIFIEGRDTPVLNFCANNYLGLSGHAEVIEASQNAMDHYGFGMSSVRFICGTQEIHKKLERELSAFLETEDTLLYNSCFDANGGLFENLLREEDLVISASLNHASIIDGIRLSKAQRKVFHYNDMEDLEKVLRDSPAKGICLVVTDGVFSMEGEFASLDKICALCEKYNALLVVDDSHATGFIGPKGKGTAEHFGVHAKVDLFTGTLGKALGGATGGYISGSKELIEWFRNTSRPYLFSNSLAPPLVAGARKSLEIVTGATGAKLRNQLLKNTLTFRTALQKIGFSIPEGVHPIVPIMLGEAKIAIEMADSLLNEGIYVIGFSYPVVPKGEARIRVQISAAHTEGQLEKAIKAFEKLGKKYKVI